MKSPNDYIEKLREEFYSRWNRAWFDCKVNYPDENRWQNQNYVLNFIKSLITQRNTEWMEEMSEKSVQLDK